MSRIRDPQRARTTEECGRSTARLPGTPSPHEALTGMLANRLPIAIGSAGFDGAPGLRRAGPTPVPGCLTGESEERETWTAGSLRAASSREDAAGRDFGGTRFRSHHGS